MKFARGRRLSFSTSCLVAMMMMTFYMHANVYRIYPANINQFELSFIAANSKGCEDIAPNVSMSQLYEQAKSEFQRTVKNAARDDGFEDHSGNYTAQYKAMHFLAGQRHVKTVCETGFNLGHSSFNYLTANDQLIVHSFDLGYHKYAHYMSEYLRDKFPGRFFIHFGDSVDTVPEFTRGNPDFRCDFMFIDGGHSYAVVLDDIKHFSTIANLESNVIILDGYPSTRGETLGEAWNHMRKAGVIKENMRCSFTSPNTDHGFIIGRVVKRP